MSAMSLEVTETYTPKANRRWNRLPSPFTLKSLAMQQVLKLLSSIQGTEGDEEIAQARAFLAENILPEFYGELYFLAHISMLRPQSLINMLIILPTTFEHVDLVGCYR